MAAGRGKLGLALAFVVALLAPASAQAAKPGDLDRSLGDGGKMVRHFCTHPRSGQVVIDDHGRIVFAGSNNNQAEFCVARYRRNGRRDRSFSGDGKVTTDIGVADSARSLAIDSRGRIVVAGATGPSEGLLDSVAVARYMPDGRLDTSFSGDGNTTTPFGDRYDYARSVAIDSHDRIVVAGASEQDFGLARFKWNGALDGSFGAGGKVMTDFGGNDFAVSVAIDSRNRIVAAGVSTTAVEDNETALARYYPGGGLDPTFGDGGMVTTNFGQRLEETHSMAIDGQRIVVAGFRETKHGDRFKLARYRQDGKFDYTSFSNRVEGIAESVGIDSRGRIIAAGFHRHGFRLACFRSNGSLDTRFGGNGTVSMDWAADAHSVAIDSRDRIVAVGWHSHLVLARFIGY